MPQASEESPAQTGEGVPSDGLAKKTIVPDPLDQRIMWTVCALLGLLSTLLVASVALQWQKYDSVIRVAAVESPPDHSAVLCYARALDAAVIKTCALMLGFTVVFLGALYVLRTTTVAFSLGLSGKGYNGTLQTTSPGLVMITLGLAIVATTVLTKADIDYHAPTYLPQAQGVAPAAVHEIDRGRATPTLRLEGDDGGKK